MECQLKEELIQSIFFTVAEDLHKSLKNPQIEQ